MATDQLTLDTANLSGKLVIIHTNDTHGADVAVEGKSLGTAGIAQLVKDYESAGADVLLISTGDAIRGDLLVNLSKGSKCRLNNKRINNEQVRALYLISLSQCHFFIIS